MILEENMINNAYEIIIETLKPVIDSQKFTRQGEEYVFSNDKKAFRINHNAERNIFELDVANLEGGEAEFVNISNYLFDDSSDERDARSVGGDFLDSLNNELGIQRSVALRRKDVALPSKRNTAGPFEISKSFSLDIFPPTRPQPAIEVS